MKSGDFLHIGNEQCLAVLPFPGSFGGNELKVRRGVVMQWEGSAWHELLQFENNIRSSYDYIGIDFIDPEARYGFEIETANKRSDGTDGFTLSFTYLDPNLRPAGVPVEVSWNRKVGRFQEYAPNELDPPDFKPEIAHPPVH